MSAPVSFEERRKELEALISEARHELWERGLSITTDAKTAAADQEAFVDGLARKLEQGLEALPPRTSARTLAGIAIQVAAERLCTVVSLAAGLSATDRRGLATLLRLSEQERRTLATILHLPGEERSELARVFGLSKLECQALAAFIGDHQTELPQESALPKRRKPAERTTLGGAEGSPRPPSEE
jgi:hypothetical protein